MYNLKYNRSISLNWAFIACIIAVIVVLLINQLPYQMSLTKEFQIGKDLVIPSIPLWYLPIFVFLIVFEVKYIYYFSKLFKLSDLSPVIFVSVIGFILCMLSLNLNKLFLFDLVSALIFIFILLSVFFIAFRQPSSNNEGFGGFEIGISFMCFTTACITSIIVYYNGISIVLLELVNSFLSTLLCVSMFTLCVNAVIPSVIAIVERIINIIKSPSVIGIMSNEQASA